MSLRSINHLAYALCLIAPWSLLWLDSDMLFPYTTGKAWVFRSVVELAFVLSLTLRIERFHSGIVKKMPVPGARVFTYTLLGFLLWTAVCNIFGIDAYRSFWSNWERMGGFIDYVHWAMYLFCLLTLISRERSRLMLFNLAIIITLVCVIGLLDTEKRSISTLGNPIYVGNLAVFGLFIAASLFTGREIPGGWKGLTLRLLLLITIVIAVFAIVKSASRGPVFALFAGGVVVVLVMLFEWAGRHSRAAVRILFLGLVLSGGLLLSQTGKIQQMLSQSENYALQRLGEVSLTDQTTADRFENWRIAFDAAQSRPWMGWGQENYMIAFNQHYRPGVIDQAKLWFDRAHNAYLDVLVASGIPGFLLYCLMLGIPVGMVWQIKNWTTLKKSIVTGLLTAFMVKNLVGFDTFSSTLIWISVMAIILNSSKEPVPEHAVQPVSESPGLKFVALGLILVSIFSIYSLNIMPYQENRRFAGLMNNPLALDSKELGAILKLPDSRLRYANNSKLAVFDNLLKNVDDESLDAIKAQRVEQVFRRAGVLVNAALRDQPENYRIKYNGALLLARFGQYDLSIRLLEELTQASPNRTAFWYALAQVYAAQGRDEFAFRARETAATLNPDWKP